ncbi:GNAT family N-acetyltransferase [Enterococcus sp. LJL51]|uniref:GNAT family N-acetyltransferase n=1 Tax=Enterococcus sp. LJL51 TaxID=3416656 RepID=UPI003CFB4FCB
MEITIFKFSCNEELFGFFCVFQENHSETIEFGMGIKPEHTGQGLGQKYLEAVLVYLIENYCFTSIRLAVAEFNQRAITLYKRLSFEPVKTYQQQTNGSSYLFLIMEKNQKSKEAKQRLEKPFTIIEFEEKTLVGISTLSEDETPDMSLWGRFYKDCYPVILDKCSEQVYELYTDLSKSSRDCQISITCEAGEEAALPAHIETHKIPKGKYTCFVVRGEVYKAVPEFWESFHSSILPFKRTYLCDFEEYPNSETKDVELKIYIGIH